MRSDLSRVPIMEEGTLRALIAQYSAASAIQEYHWQGGEPTLCGLDFFRYAVHHQPPRAENVIQTNGVMLDEAWAEFFVEHRWAVQVSYDGLCGGMRGRGSEKALDALDLLRRYNVAYGVSCVVSEDNIRYPERVVQDIALRSSNVAFIARKATCPEKKPGTVPTGIQMANFLSRALAEIDRLGLKLSIRNFDSSFHSWRGHPLTCEVEPRSCGYAVVTEKGDVYPCDFFTEEPEWRLGNILETPLRLLMEGATMAEFRSLKSKPHPTCEACEVRGGCGRGCPRDRWLVNGSFDDLSGQCASAKYVAEITRP